MNARMTINALPKRLLICKPARRKKTSNSICEDFDETCEPFGALECWKENPCGGICPLLAGRGDENK